MAVNRVRYVGSYPVIEDAGTRADPSLPVNLRLARDWQGFGVAVDLFNLLDRRGEEVAYLCSSRLQGEPVDGVEDLHSHVFQPRSARLPDRKSF